MKPLTAEQHEGLHAIGVKIQEQVDADTYLCRYEPSDLQPIRAKSFVRQADELRSKFKIVSDLKETNVLAAKRNSFVATTMSEALQTQTSFNN